MLLYITADSSKCISLNILRSTGRPGVTVAVNTLVCLFILLPFGWLLGLFLHFGLYGLWGSMSIAWLAATIVYLNIVWKTNWKDTLIKNIQAGRKIDRNELNLNFVDTKL
jgi:Na+-driven multidrug efflux pump